MTRIVWQRLDVPGLEWAEIEVDAEGLVVTYGGYWQVVGREA